MMLPVMLQFLSLRYIYSNEMKIGTLTDPCVPMFIAMLMTKEKNKNYLTVHEQING